MSELPPRSNSIKDPQIDWNVAIRTEVFLDGELQSEVTAYDCDDGWVDKYRTDAAGNFVVDRSTDKVFVDRHTGTVTVAWKAS